METRTSDFTAGAAILPPAAPRLGRSDVLHDLEALSRWLLVALPSRLRLDPRRVVLWARRAPAPWHPKCDGTSDHRSDTLVMDAVELVLPALQLLQPTAGAGGALVARQAVVFLADRPELRPREAFLPWAFVRSACPGGPSRAVAPMAAR